MIKKLLTLLFLIVLNINLTSGIFAVNSENLFVRLDNPSSPTNTNNLTLSFTVLDIQNRALTVTCYKKNPNGSVEQLTTVNIIAGGNSGSCNLDNHTMSESGKTYSFYATALVGAEEFESAPVSVEFNSSAPSNPTDFSKEEINTCDYKISFRTANDNRTTKVAVYRSDLTNFNADNNTLVALIDIGPNQSTSIINSVPDCNKNYYYVLRALDSAGNTSGFVGDSVNVTSTSTSTTSSLTPAVGAIAVRGANIDQESIIPSGTQNPQSTDSGTILGEQNPSPTSIVAKVSKMFTSNWLIFIGGLALIILGIITYVRSPKKTTKKKW